MLLRLFRPKDHRCKRKSDESCRTISNKAEQKTSEMSLHLENYTSPECNLMAMAQS